MTLDLLLETDIKIHTESLFIVVTLKKYLMLADLGLNFPPQVVIIKHRAKNNTVLNFEFQMQT